MTSFNFQGLCQTTGDVLSSTSTIVVQASKDIINTVPGYYWAIGALLTGMALTHFYQRRLRRSTAKKRENLFKHFQRLKGLIKYRLLSGVHRQKMRAPTQDVLADTKGVKKFVESFKNKKKDNDKRMHTL